MNSEDELEESIVIPNSHEESELNAHEEDVLRKYGIITEDDFLDKDALERRRIMKVASDHNVPVGNPGAGFVVPVASLPEQQSSYDVDSEHETVYMDPQEPVEYEMDQVERVAVKPQPTARGAPPPRKAPVHSAPKEPVVPSTSYSTSSVEKTPLLVNSSAPMPRQRDCCVVM